MGGYKTQQVGDATEFSTTPETVPYPITMLAIPAVLLVLICFATGINTAKWVIGQLFAHGRVRRAYIGVSGANVRIATRIMRHFELPSPGAVHVADVAAESPAARAGVAAGDRIVALDGEPVDGIDSLQRLLDASRIGRSCELKLLRRAAVLSLSVRPIELPARDA